MQWHTLRIYYYDDDKRALILDGVRPLFDRLAAEVSGMYYTRHWRRGPHLRLNIHCDAISLDAVVRPAAEAVIGGFLVESPSTALLDPYVQLPMHRRLAQLEADTGQLLPWYGDNSFFFTAFEDRSSVLGGPEAASLLADFYTETNRLAFHMTESIVANSQRLAVGFDLMIATAYQLSGLSVAGGSIAFRSHAEGFLNVFPEAQDMRRGWDEHYRRHGPALASRVRAVIATLDGSSEKTPFVRDWVGALIPLRERAARLLNDAKIQPSHAASIYTTADFVEHSEFHRKLYDHPGWDSGVESTAWFRLYRLILNLTYLQLTRLGIRPAERFLLCHLAANTVQDSK